MNLIETLDKEQMEKLSAGKTMPDFGPGDTVLVNVKVKEGDKSRVQAYEGVCIGRHGAGISQNFTVRKISYGEGVERVFPLFAPMIESVKVVRRGKVRRCARTGSRIGNLSRPCAGQCDHVFHCAYGQRRVDGEHVGRIRQPGNRLEIAQRVVGNFLVEALVHGGRADAAYRERVAVGCCARRDFGADYAARARAGLDHHLLTKRRAERARNYARAEIDVTAG